MALPAAAAPGLAEGGAAFQFVQKNCAGCHNSSVSSGGIDFTTHQKAETFVQDRAIWERALAKLKAGEMPPPGAPKPPAAETGAVTKWLESEFARQDSTIQPD